MTKVYEALLRHEKRRGDTYRKRALILARRAHARRSANRMILANYTILKERFYSTVRLLEARILDVAKLKDQLFDSMTKHAKELEECRDITGRPVGADWIKCHKTELENMRLKERVESLEKAVNAEVASRADLQEEIYRLEASIGQRR